MKRLLTLLFLGLTCLSPALAAPPAPADLPDLVERVLPGVVNISSVNVVQYQGFGMEEFLRFWGIPQEHKQSSLGTGFIIDAAEGLVVTNHHVVESADEVIVTLIDKRQLSARIVGKDPKLDLALLQLRGEDRKVPGQLKAATLGQSESVRIAEPVFAVGNPFGLSHTVTMGIISAKNRTIGLGPFDNFLQTDASINPGNSGGPLFNLKGEVIGINTVIYSRVGQSGGLGFAIPVSELQKILPDLKRYGRVPRPWLGVLVQPMNSAIARSLGLRSPQGALVLNLVQGSPASRIGLQRGDVIIAVNEQKVQEPLDLERSLGLERPKEQVSITLLRDGRKMTLKLKLEELPRRIEKLPQGVI
jgi:serine protease Do